ncbi:hypothetical protein D0C16_12945 [Cellvibrio sp. KY-GH-1]|uniref:hypothetical protein n=1 Tax=Cellvibrio sp. KY-GH-1 TaxID=2303332 RepID=UPI001245C89D|nr:hypothetical protein [Cellvibrio sp. KY-GH-1]QEY16797.1 hypothetical protein D0C16_12945 [Cellvibrio sp. KY-GH-1]
MDLQGASPEQAARLKQQLEATKAKLESADDVQLATLTIHNLVGDLLYGTVFNYFALNDLQDQIAAQCSAIINYRLPSYGTFSTNLETQYCNLHPWRLSSGPAKAVQNCSRQFCGLVYRAMSPSVV